MGVMGLVEEGRLTLEMSAYDVIRTHTEAFEELCKYPILLEQTKEITIQHLLCHYGGLSHYLRPCEYTCTEKVTSQIECIKRYGSGEHVVHKAGSQFLYSSYGYNMLGLIVEIVSGLTYEKFIERYLFGPLGKIFHLIYFSFHLSFISFIFHFIYFSFHLFFISIFVFINIHLLLIINSFHFSDLSYNSISGTLSSQLGNLTSLTTL